MNPNYKPSQTLGYHNPVVRLPVGKGSPSFRLPLVASDIQKRKYSNRTVQLISVKHLRNLGKIPFEATHNGTLKVNRVKNNL